MSASLRFVLVVLFFGSIILIQGPLAWAGEDWLPITPEELKMTSEPKAPGAQAICLYRQVDRDDLALRENIYYRIKIFTEEGRKYANIEIPFVNGSGNIKDIKARTIHPDGTIVNFEGKPYERMIVKAKGFKFLAKTFTIPDVQAGSILEYRFTRSLPFYTFNSSWILSDELFTKRAKFSFRRSRSLALQWSWPRGLPDGTNPPVDDHGVIRLEAQDIPAFQIEDYMPPQQEMKYRVDFNYEYDLEKDPDKFWQAQAKWFYGGISSFTDKHKAMQEALAQIIMPGDAPDQKLRKIYARCQKVRNTSFEINKTEQEQQREKVKNIASVEDVWKHGYGNRAEISWLFLALVRAAGFDATPVLISTRDQHFFKPKLMNPHDLNNSVVLVKQDGNDLYLDPGTPFTPFGLLPWYETAVPGLRVEKDGGTWIRTTVPDLTASGIERTAVLQLNESGSLEGRVTVIYKGLSALWRRIDERGEDEVQRKRFLEDDLKGSIPLSAEVELTNTPDWASSSNSLVAEFHINVPSWTSAAGHRSLMQAEVFGANEKHTFEGATRVHPIVFEYPFTDIDDVAISVPPNWHVENLPSAKLLDYKNCTYGFNSETKQGAIHLNRKLMLNLAIVDAANYGLLRTFYQSVRTGDEQQIVLSSTP